MSQRDRSKTLLDFPDCARDTINNAVLRRWTAREGSREIGPERGLFILQPDLSDVFGSALLLPESEACPQTLTLNPQVETLAGDDEFAANAFYLG